MSQVFMTQFVASAFQIATPLALACLGGIFAERAGVIVVCLEGMMLAGAFGGFAISMLSNNPWWGLVGAMVAGLIVALAHGLVCVTFRADHIVSGVAINLVSLGATGSLYQSAYGTQTLPPSGPTLPPLGPSSLQHIPVIGAIVFGQNYLVFAAPVVAVIAWLFLFRTPWGLSIRAAGQLPDAVEAAGLNVHLIRYASLAVCGVLAGIGGGFLTVGQLNTFFAGMTAGRGFIAYTAMILAKWHPIAAILVVLLFGFADALQDRLQPLGIAVPYQVFLMFPYVITLLALVLFSRRARYPAAAGRPYPLAEG